MNWYGFIQYSGERPNPGEVADEATKGTWPGGKPSKIKDLSYIRQICLVPWR